MQQTIDIRVLELLASRLCHDLVGPVGAVNNGLELLVEDDEMGLADEAVGQSHFGAEVDVAPLSRT